MMKRSTQKVVYKNKKTGKIKYYYYKNSGDSRSRITGKEYGQLRIRETKVIVNGKVKFNVDNYTKSLSLSERSAFNSQVNSLIHKEGKSYTLAQVEAMASGNKAAIAMANTGLSLQQVAKELHTSEKALLDENNWKDASGKTGSYFTNPDTGITYKLNVNYEGETNFEEVKAE